MSLTKQRKGQIGVNVVERVVLHQWHARWQPIDSVNDDGIDGLIFLESRGAPSGQIIFAQVKCTKSKINGSGRIPIPIAKKKLRMNVDRWRRVIGAAILIHVDPDTLEAHWVDLREENAIGNTQVFVPENNLFDRDARKLVAALCGTIHRDLLMKRVQTSANDFIYLTSHEHIQTAARKFYREMQHEKICLGQSGKRVHFTREGWHHITRRDRPRLTQLQSFQLLGAVRQVIQSTEEEELVNLCSTSGEPEGIVSISAAVSFPYRSMGIVKILLWSRCSSAEGVNYSFRTVYEPRRRKNILGT